MRSPSREKDSKLPQERLERWECWEYAKECPHPVSSTREYGFPPLISGIRVNEAALLLNQPSVTVRGCLLLTPCVYVLC